MKRRNFLRAIGAYDLVNDDRFELIDAETKTFNYLGEPDKHYGRNCPDLVLSARGHFSPYVRKD